MNNQESGCINSCIKLVIALGIVSLIVLLLELPSTISFFNNRKKVEAKAEVKQYLSSMNKAQQAYFAEKSAFATSVNDLGLGIKTETSNYKYSVQTTKKAAFSYGVSKEKNLKSYVGGVFVIQVNSNNSKDEMRTESILCSADKHGAIRPLPPTLQKDKLVCGTGTTQVTN